MDSKGGIHKSSNGRKKNWKLGTESFERGLKMERKYGKKNLWEYHHIL